MTNSNPNVNPSNPYDYPTSGADNNYEASFASKIEEIFKIPDTNDMAALIIRGNFKNDRQLNAILRLSYRHMKFNDKTHQDLLRQKIAGTAAIHGLARVEGLSAAVNMIAPDLWRAVKDMPKAKDEKVMRGGSDFRSQDRPQDGAERPR
jgi:hypothetical protein